MKSLRGSISEDTRKIKEKRQNPGALWIQEVRKNAEWPVREEGNGENLETWEPRDKTEMFQGGSQAMLPVIMTMLTTTAIPGPTGGMSLCSGDLLTSRITRFAHPHLCALAPFTTQISAGFKAVFLSPFHRWERQLRHWSLTRSFPQCTGKRTLCFSLLPTPYTPYPFVFVLFFYSSRCSRHCTFGELEKSEKQDSLVHVKANLTTPI